ncbi:hypothetical protein MNEG_3096 [Monoraphidium neglectum]|uniref:Uncharacterized protein n=1 Tax=Monoraphidium neglectum TaxID=145388 RepID=A0A0D2LDS9_9CHLO|nr:hypothetical protein MNEG_3096 [Monoraphidium neglectum]KIZ04864.1 hypothetical protein MNEG_3096 [Monoraphidium neglectum]|eukprot:XP_013903883.1 hypothetical protein MNEG_3096 [Monoraphidium neglectum]
MAQQAVATLGQLLEQALAAFDDEQKTVSATTRKRMAVRAIQGIKLGQELIKSLASELRQLEATAHRWEDDAAHAGDSQRELMGRLERAARDLDAATAQLRAAEAGRMAALGEAEVAERRAAEASAELQALRATLGQREAEARSAVAGVSEAQSHVSQLAAECDVLREAAREALEASNAAGAALQAAKDEATGERQARQRHEDAIARLTADNLVFLTRAREAEAALGAARSQAADLRAALDEHRGPWFEEVAAGVEERVRAAMARADALQRELAEAREAAAATEQALRGERAELEQLLHESRSECGQLASQLSQAGAAEAAAREEAEAAQVLAAAARVAAEERAAELRVAQDTLRAMREEVNERWARERGALAQLEALEGQAQAAQDEAVWLRRQLQEREGELSAQRDVNVQLMAKKEDMEWQLMSAVAALQAAGLSSGGLSPPPLTLQVAGALNLDRTVPQISVTRKRNSSSGGGGLSGGVSGRLFEDVSGVVASTPAPGRDVTS